MMSSSVITWMWLVVGAGIHMDGVHGYGVDEETQLLSLLELGTEQDRPPRAKLGKFMPPPLGPCINLYNKGLTSVGKCPLQHWLEGNSRQNSTARKYDYTLSSKIFSATVEKEYQLIRYAFSSKIMEIRNNVLKPRNFKTHKKDFAAYFEPGTTTGDDDGRSTTNAIFRFVADRAKASSGLTCSDGLAKTLLKHPEDDAEADELNQPYMDCANTDHRGSHKNPDQVDKDRVMRDCEISAKFGNSYECVNNFITWNFVKFRGTERDRAELDSLKGLFAEYVTLFTGYDFNSIKGSEEENEARREDLARGETQPLAFFFPSTIFHKSNPFVAAAVITCLRSKYYGRADENESSGTENNGQIKNGADEHPEDNSDGFIAETECKEPFHFPKKDDIEAQIDRYLDSTHFKAGLPADLILQKLFVDDTRYPKRNRRTRLLNSQPEESWNSPTNERLESWKSFFATKKKQKERAEDSMEKFETFLKTSDGVRMSKQGAKDALHAGLVAIADTFRNMSKDEIKERFENADVNGDGRIEIKELKKVMDDEILPDLHLWYDHLEKIIAEIDSDDDKKFDLNDLIAAVEKLDKDAKEVTLVAADGTKLSKNALEGASKIGKILASLNKEDIMAKFKDADLNRDGKVDTKELKVLMEKTASGVRLTEDDLQQIIDLIDTDEDKLISESELVGAVDTMRKETASKVDGDKDKARKKAEKEGGDVPETASKVDGDKDKAGKNAEKEAGDVPVVKKLEQDMVVYE